MTYNAGWMNDELRLMAESVRSFLENEYVPHDAKYEAQHFVDREFWKKAAEMGMLGATIPGEYGGIGGNFAFDAVISDELAAQGISGFGIQVHNIASHYILAYGSEEQKKKWLPRLCSGECIGAIAMTEPGAGSDLQGVTTKAVKDGDFYTITGSKTFISNGLLANLIVLVVKTDESKGAKGISLVVVETEDLAGFTRGKPLEKIGQHAQDTTELFFDGARVPCVNLLGKEEGKGFYQLMDQLKYERLLIAVLSVGFMDRALKMTFEYTQDRKAFGRTIFDFQNTRFKLAELFTEARIGRTFVADCIEKMIAGKLDTATASMAKMWLTEKLCKTVDECLQFFGGYGYTREYPISRLFVDSRVMKIYGGTSEIMKELIARSLQ
ncbi:acyl-CoA dehydrogenase family protein [Desulforhopalus singaporensis]|uniref:Acyl-CoA dehydrogenase n=1 Tax=Desulforhopalus singaporensis TaxID=91360 RepID=A0A1H0UFP1_9BACT|nr:acyl-CoA dehydrogenase family protein [Desulforhopalus singaporensis]SDP64808.1 acyl-CoA dehydrogenase [Desulforhopalus singaporensis]